MELYGAMKRFARVAGRILLLVCFAAMVGWGTLAIYYSNLPPRLRPAAAICFGAAGLFLDIRGWNNRRARLIFLAAFAALLVWWLLIPPSNSRDWQPDVAVLPWATIDGNRVTIRNIRNCDYRSETDYTVRHYDKSFDLDKLRSIDLYLVYWGSSLVAHTMISFGFEGDDYVCFSIETRKTKGEDYSTVKGFFKQYELTYVVADERDVVRLRTNYRNEDVYLYRLKARPAITRSVFLDYLQKVNRLKEHPAWYNALTDNCTTNIRQHASPYSPKVRLDWRILVNGYADEMAYERGLLDQSLPFPQLKQRSYINDDALAADNDASFSRTIRRGLPGVAEERTFR